MPLKEDIKRLFPGLVSFRNRLYNYVAHYRFKHLPVDKVFEIIHQENHWHDSESISGTGSNKKNTESVMHIVSKVIVELKVKSFLDIPCGDFNWMKEIDLNGVNYIGADIVSDLVLRNNDQYSNGTIVFEKLNILESVLPAVDLIFCRDCLVHFSYNDIHRAIKSFKNSGSTYLMTTTFPSHRNYNIITGDWRPINMVKAPFNFPQPIYIYNELCVEDSRYADKSLAIWRTADL